MKTEYVFDTSALCAYYLGEAGGGIAHLFSGTGHRAMHAVNVAEFCFTLCRKMATAYTPQDALKLLVREGIDCMAVFEKDFLLLTAEIRLAVPALSVGDGFAVALASVMDAPVLTADRAFKRAADFARIELIR